jgi:hypothetical protein
MGLKSLSTPHHWIGGHTITSTLRFFRRPSQVELSKRGFNWPKYWMVIISERILDSHWLYSEPPAIQVLPKPSNSIVLSLE